jgi:hypothetical protein
LAISEESVLYGYYIIADPNSVKQTLMNLKDVGPLFFSYSSKTQQTQAARLAVIIME